MGAPPDMSPSAAGGRCSEGAVCAAVDKIKERRKPEDFIGQPQTEAGSSDLSEWPRSVGNEGAPSPRRPQGTATGARQVLLCPKA